MPVVNPTLPVSLSFSNKCILTVRELACATERPPPGASAELHVMGNLGQGPQGADPTQSRRPPWHSVWATVPASLAWAASGAGTRNCQWPLAQPRPEVTHGSVPGAITILCGRFRSSRDSAYESRVLNRTTRVALVC